VNLSWERPVSDGGSPITHYIVQKKVKGKTDWEECGVLETPSGKEPLAYKVMIIFKFFEKVVNIYGKSWRVGNASRNETNKILTIYLWKVWGFLPRSRIRVI